MAANYVLLEKITVGAAGASSVTFSGIPQTGYTDLVVKVSGRTDRANAKDELKLKFNASATGYTDRTLYADGSAAASNSGVATTYFWGGYPFAAASATASVFGNGEVYIPNYASANYKSASVDVVGEDNNATAYCNLTAGLWSNTSAITSVSIESANGASFVQYSTFYLYGVAAYGTTPAIVPYATGGDTIMTDGTYWYHAFKASGTFTPAKSISCDVVVVAGGGGGGGDGYSGVRNGGGGGAGGVFYATSQTLSTAQTVTIGSGGAGGNANVGANGSNSSFGSLTAGSGGGGGGGHTAVVNQNGVAGGSGGGAANGGTGGAANQTGSGGTGYGFAGGSGGGGTGGGGGGSGAVGSNGNGTNGNGGAGLNTWSAWATATGTGASGYYAGGGGAGGNGTAGTGSAGGGGGSAAVGAAATANTGSGGGGGRNTGGIGGGAGGSGIVIVRYAV